MSEEAKNKRLYLTQEFDDRGALVREKIVEGASQAQAIKLVVGERFKASAASARDVARVMAAEAATKGSL